MGARSFAPRSWRLLGVAVASHVVANALSPRFIEPEAEDLPEIADALRARVEADVAGGFYAHPGVGVLSELVGRLEVIWHRALRGELIAGASLDRLQEIVESGSAVCGPAREVALRLVRVAGLVGHRSPLALEVRRASGLWTVTLKHARHAQQLRESLLGTGSHALLGVAAELCARSNERRSTGGGERASVSP